MYIFKTLFQRVPLAQAKGGQQGIVLAVGAAVEVALRLGVSDQLDFCHQITSRYFTMSSRIFMAAARALS